MGTLYNSVLPKTQDPGTQGPKLAHCTVDGTFVLAVFFPPNSTQSDVRRVSFIAGKAITYEHVSH